MTQLCVESSGTYTPVLTWLCDPEQVTSPPEASVLLSGCLCKMGLNPLPRVLCAVVHCGVQCLVGRLCGQL